MSTNCNTIRDLFLIKDHRMSNPSCVFSFIRGCFITPLTIFSSYMVDKTKIKGLFHFFNTSVSINWTQNFLFVFKCINWRLLFLIYKVYILGSGFIYMCVYVYRYQKTFCNYQLTWRYLLRISSFEMCVLLSIDPDPEYAGPLVTVYTDL